MSLTVAQAIAALPPDAIAQVVNAYRDAWEALGSEGKAPNVMRAYEAAAQAFRDALASVLPRLGDALPEPPKCDRCGKELGKDADAYCRGHGEPPQPYFGYDEVHGAVPVALPQRWNVEEVEGGVRVCMGLHERSAPCEWVFYARASRAPTGAASRARAPGEETPHD